MKHKQNCITKESSLALYESKWWLSKSPREIAMFQLFTNRLCLPFGEFQEAIEKAIGRPVFTHELADPDHIIDELLGNKPAPTMEEIINLIPEGRRVVVMV